MYIRELQVDGYGALQGVKLELDAPVSVLYGPNEAGKSTLLRFVRSMLYGFPTRKDPVERGEPVFGGRHGGRLLLADKSGNEWVLERYAERSNMVTLRDGSGIEKTLGQAEWQRMMLGGISERTFKQLFSVSLNELHELRSLQGEEIGNYLYHAGLAGGSAITSARRQLGSEMDRLFRPKGTTQEMNRILSEIKDIESAIRQSRDGVQSYLNAKETLAQAESRIRSIEETLPELRLQAAKLQGAYELREWWLKRELLLAEDAEIRSRLPDPTAPLLDENARSSWEEWKKQRDEAYGNLSAIQKELSEVRSLRERLTWDEALLASYPELERLEAMREAVIAKREERAELEAERRTLDESVRHILPRLSGQWGEAELLAFGGSEADREEVRKLQQSWEQEERASVSLQSELRRFARQIEVLETERNSSQSLAQDDNALRPSIGSDLPFGPFVPRTKSALLQAWHNVEDARREYERARSTLRPSRPKFSRVHSNSGQAGRSNGNAAKYAIAGLLGATAVALPFLLNEGGNIPFLAYAVSACLLLLSASIAIVVSRRRAGNEDRSATPQDNAESEQYIASVRIHQKLLNDKLRQLLEHAETAAAELVPLPPEAIFDDAISNNDTLDSVWQQLRGAVHEQLEQFEEWNRTQSKQQELQERAQELRMEKDLVEKDFLEISDRLDVLRLHWQEWLNIRRLPLHLKPDSLPELFGIAEQGQAALRQLRRVTERSQTLLQTIREFEQAASAIMAVYPPPAGVRADAAHAVQWLYRDAVKQLGAKEEAVQLDRRLVAVEASAEEARLQADRIGTVIAELFREANVETESEWEHRLRLDERCLALRKEAREIQLRLESGRDRDAQQQLYELLHAYDDATLATLLNERKLALVAEEELRSELLDQRGRIAQELDRLRTEAEHEDKIQNLRQLQSKLELLTERYAVLAISDRLIARTKAVFEEEQQPEVLRLASRYFRQMTNGAYARIVAPGDTKALFAEAKDRTLLDSSFLSRGTQEQLYLAMRFALCDAASPEQPLPLLLDDLFVHFDERRLAQALPVLEEIAEGRQVVLFTCHRYEAQLIAEGIPSSRLLTLEG